MKTTTIRKPKLLIRFNDSDKVFKPAPLAADDKDYSGGRLCLDWNWSLSAKICDFYQSRFLLPATPSSQLIAPTIMSPMTKRKRSRDNYYDSKITSAAPVWPALPIFTFFMCNEHLAGDDWRHLASVERHQRQLQSGWRGLSAMNYQLILLP